ncbi:uncharacterized protein LOC114315205 [Camellia sinensis]|uniref:uncharacterized protein LOC114315205 n=1 Tax=Camellia sinensis TaxID=4442 RepID=UPI0010361B19|nr:uncharacterized protein LOC114315205 [Camellia sinensis]
MKEMLRGRNEAFQRNFWMSRDVFLLLCKTLVEDFGLPLPQRPHGVDIVESVSMFIFALQGFSSWDIEDRFQHSEETVCCHVMRVLKAMKCTLSTDEVTTQQTSVLRVSTKIFAISSSMHDDRVFNEVTQDPTKQFSTLEDGKYYLVDAGYKNQKGLLAPFKGCRYHQEEFPTTGWARDANEVFNTVHSSLWSAIERTFGVWKARWGFLHNMPRYDFGKVNVPLVGASLALHNFIHRNSNNDEAFNKVANAETFTFNMPNVAGVGDDDDGELEGDDDIHINEVRKSIQNELV